MKKIYSLLAFVFFLPFFLNAQWTTLSTNAPSANFIALSFPADDSGFLAGPTVYRTFDGGNTFDTVQRTLAQYNSLNFRTNLDGAICGYGPGGASVQRTINSGLTWTDITPDSVLGSVMDVQFSTALKGVVLTSSNAFYVTQDGGLNWDSLMFGYDYFNALDFGDQQSGYIGGFDGTFAYRGVIAKTTDSGVTWNVIVNFTEWNTTIQKIHFVNADTGFASFNPFMTPSHIIRTLDGGASWDTIIFTQGQVVDFAFTNAENGFVVNDSGSIYRTFDAGANWVLDRPSTGTLNVICVTPAFAYAAGSNGLIVKRNLAAGIIEPAPSLQSEIYPNPGSDLVTVNLPVGFQPQQVTVLDMTGRNCGELEWRRNGTGIEVGTAALSKGWYMLEVTGVSGSVKLRFGKV